jgi:uncharacterized BrkB/YihY/UPF0761 family membrane protein
MPTKLAQLQEIFRQSRTDEEQREVASRRLKSFFVFFGAVLAFSLVRVGLGDAVPEPASRS